MLSEKSSFNSMLERYLKDVAVRFVFFQGQTIGCFQPKKRRARLHIGSIQPIMPVRVTPWSQWAARNKKSRLRYGSAIFFNGKETKIYCLHKTTAFGGGCRRKLGTACLLSSPFRGIQATRYAGGLFTSA
jgi:hypothetical protein